ncbi:mechanosensitive ion channel [Pricia sp. S334]|uniref:Mechanosensitive ion channel n=1 Tax=Pricia mediterranea TaxID=3076079 RepID=A0ABU3L970_9FLAO|nr:mechanosensitive ion channel domain-containing protein [Pricia sp. S334]MDT7829734.1 mechanosensitive ion channel [Pricia sp. S334]
MILLQKDVSKIEEILEEDIWGSIKHFLQLGFSFGEGDNKIQVTIGLLLVLALAFMVSTLLMKWLRNFLTRNMEGEHKLKFFSVFKFIRYLVYITVVLITMSAAGVDITLLLTASAALFVGLGLALQNVFQDVIGGIFIITDKSLHVGDVVEVEGKVGKVFQIKLRTTRALTRDDKVIVIPNHHFINNVIYNYTQNHKMTREKVSIRIAYGDDVQLVVQILEKAANDHQEILKSPEPFVRLEDFAEWAMLLTLNFFIDDSFADPGIKSDLRYKIEAGLRDNGITIPVPRTNVKLYPSESYTVVRTDKPKDENET